MKYISPEKPKICPKCGSIRIVNILYGEPSYEVHLEEVAGKIILGGCILTGDDPAWGCLNCKVKIYRKKG